MKLKQLFCDHIWKKQYEYPSGFKKTEFPYWTAAFFDLCTEYIVHAKCVKCDKEKVYLREKKETIWNM